MFTQFSSQFLQHIVINTPGMLIVQIVYFGLGMQYNINVL